MSFFLLIIIAILIWAGISVVVEEESKKKVEEKAIIDYWNKKHAYAKFDKEQATKEYYSDFPWLRKKTPEENRAEYKEKERIEKERLQAEKEKTLLRQQKEWNYYFPEKKFSEYEYNQWKLQEKEKARQARQEAEWNRAFPGEQYSSDRYNRWQADIKKKAEQKKIQEQKRQKEIEQEKRRKAELENRVKCPTCGSQNTRRLSDVEKAFDMSGFGTLAGGGLNSPSLGKTFKCDNCGYYW